jgi:hypothetical protein
MEMPHYCLTNLGKVMAHMKEYIKVAGQSYLLHLLREEDELVWMTVSMAVDFARTKPVSAHSYSPSFVLSSDHGARTR